MTRTGLGTIALGVGVTLAMLVGGFVALMAMMLAGDFVLGPALSYDAAVLGGYALLPFSVCTGFAAMVMRSRRRQRAERLAAQPPA